MISSSCQVVLPGRQRFSAPPTVFRCCACFFFYLYIFIALLRRLDCHQLTRHAQFKCSQRSTPVNFEKMKTRLQTIEPGWPDNFLGLLPTCLVCLLMSDLVGQQASVCPAQHTPPHPYWRRHPSKCPSHTDLKMLFIFLPLFTY